MKALNIRLNNEGLHRMHLYLMLHSVEFLAHACTTLACRAALLAKEHSTGNKMIWLQWCRQTR